MLSHLSNDRRLSVLVAVVVACCWCMLATLVLSGHGAGAQRDDVIDYRYEPGVVNYRTQYGHSRRQPAMSSTGARGERRPVANAVRGRQPMTMRAQRRLVPSRLRRPLRVNGGRNLDEAEFGVPRNRSNRVKRHPHIYLEQYKARNQPVGLLPYKFYPPAPVSEPCSPPDFYRMLWNDGTPAIPEETGLWTGNALVIKYGLNREFLLTHRFDPRRLDEQNLLKFLSIQPVLLGEEKVRSRAPDEGDFNQVIDSRSSFTSHLPRLIFNLGNSEFQMFTHEGADIRGLDVDEYPDLPKNNCLAYRYMPVYKKSSGASVERFVFKKTPVTVFQRPDLETIRVAQVEHMDDGFNWYHMGMPVTCEGKLSYVLYSGPTRFTNGLRVRAVSVYFLIGQLQKWASESVFKTLEDVPYADVKAERMRFG